jgi:hypothetical protein
MFHVERAAAEDERSAEPELMRILGQEKTGRLVGMHDTRFSCERVIHAISSFWACQKQV